MKVLFVSGIDGDTRRYRCLHPQEQLALSNIQSTLYEANDLHLYEAVLQYDFLILHRVSYSQLIGDCIALMHLAGKPVIFETDDLIFRPDLVEEIAYLDMLPADQAQRFRQSLALQTQTFQACDFVLTTTEYLANAARQAGKTAFVQRNACSATMLTAAEQARQARQTRQATALPPPLLPELVEGNRGGGSAVVIGYFSGTGSHNRDFASIAPALAQVLQRHAHVFLHVSGQLDLPTALRPFEGRIRRAPYVAWQELPNLLAQVDINLAPLETDNPFCQAKSEIKYSEAALVGVPTVATPTDAFQFAIVSGQNGYLASTTDEWVLALDTLIEDQALRQRIGEAARQHVYSQYTPDVRSKELLTILQKVQECFASQISDKKQVEASDQTTTLAQATAAACVRQMTQLQSQLEQQERQLASLRQTLAEWEHRWDVQASVQQNSEEQRLHQLVEFWQQKFEQSEQFYTENLREIFYRLQTKKDKETGKQINR